jgi:hypothetical protein
MAKLRTLRFCGWLIALCCGFGCQTADPPSGAGAHSIVAGSPDPGDPAVAMLLIHVPGSTTQKICSATAVGPRALVTSARCIDPSLVPAGSVVDVFLRSNPLEDPAETPIRASGIVIHPDFRPFDIDQANDIGVVQLPSDLALAPVLVSLTGPPANAVGQPVARLVGYGSTVQAQPETAGTRTQLTTLLDSFDAETVETGVAGQGLCFGDGGAPVFIPPGGPLVGVSSHGTADGQCGIGYQVRVDRKLDFLRPFIPNLAACAPNGYCDPGENPTTCPADCHCGNGTCEPALGETAANCPADCGCRAESDASFCARLGRNCGAASGNDNCGSARSVASCGLCTQPATCGGDGRPGVCGCSGESDAVLCARLGKNCGTVTAVDSCGQTRAVSCGSCLLPATCGGDNICRCVPSCNGRVCGESDGCGGVCGVGYGAGIRNRVRYVLGNAEDARTCGAYMKRNARGANKATVRYGRIQCNGLPYIAWTAPTACTYGPAAVSTGGAYWNDATGSATSCTPDPESRTCLHGRGRRFCCTPPAAPR